MSDVGIISVMGVVVVGFAILAFYFKDVADRALKDAKFWKEYGDLFKPNSGKTLQDEIKFCEQCQASLNSIMDKYKIDAIGIKRIVKPEIEGECCDK